MLKILIFLYIFLYSFPILSLEVTLTQGSVKPTPIAVTDLYSQNSNLDKIGKNISSVISDNLERSGLFIPIDEKAFIQNSQSLTQRSLYPTHPCWEERADIRLPRRVPLRTC